jgi:hypothetical protein
MSQYYNAGGWCFALGTLFFVLGSLQWRGFCRGELELKQRTKHQVQSAKRQAPTYRVVVLTPFALRFAA